MNNWKHDLYMESQYIYVIKYLHYDRVYKTYIEFKP